jgi:hypothetical protein
MKTVALCLSLSLFFVVLVAALRTIFERRFPFIRKFDEETQRSYMVLAVAGAVLFVSRYVDLRRLQSFEIAGVKTTLSSIQQQVSTLSDQVEELFKRKKAETFDTHNWDRVHRVNETGQGIELEVTLKQPPIPNSVEVYEGALLMPDQKYHVEGRVVRFPANTDKPDPGLTIEYYPRIESEHPQQTPQ